MECFISPATMGAAGKLGLSVERTRPDASQHGQTSLSVAANNSFEIYETLIRALSFLDLRVGTFRLCVTRRIQITVHHAASLIRAPSASPGLDHRWLALPARKQ